MMRTPPITLNPGPCTSCGPVTAMIEVCAAGRGQHRQRRRGAPLSTKQIDAGPWRNHEALGPAGGRRIRRPAGWRQRPRASINRFQGCSGLLPVQTQWECKLFTAGVLYDCRKE